MRAMILGLAAIAALAGVPARAQVVTPPPHLIDGTILEVSAEGRTTRVPDLAIVQAGVTTQAPSAGEAYAQANAKMSRVIAALRAGGIAERDIQTSSISLQPQYRDRESNQPPVIFAYQAQNSVTVRFRDVSKAGPILDILVREGANTISGPSLTLSQPDAAMDEARADAVAKARARAELYARAAGLRVDRILLISENGSPDLPMGGVRFRFNADKAEVMPGESEVNVTVTVRFLLK